MNWKCDKCKKKNTMRVASLAAAKSVLYGDTITGRCVECKSITLLRLKSELVVVRIVFPVDDFVENVRSKIKDSVVSMSDLYSAFKKYCNKNGSEIISLRKFSQRLSEMGIVKTRKSGVIFWEGLSL